MATRYTFKQLEVAAEDFNKTLAKSGSDVRFFAGQRNECSAIDWYKQSEHDKGETSVTNVESGLPRECYAAMQRMYYKALNKAIASST